MLYVITLAVIGIWMIAVIRKGRLSFHSIVAAYSIAVFTADMFEVLFNLLLGLYKFPTHLHLNPSDDNELGIIFADTLILPFTLIVFVYYASKKINPWKISLPFAIGFIVLEWIFLQFGYMKYIHWSLAISAAFYVTGFRIAAYLAPRIVTYGPPVPYRLRLMAFSHTFIMWVGALFASPLFKMYEYRPGVFKEPMADCRFTDLLTGDILALLITIFIPMIPKKARPIAFAAVACIGISFAFLAHYQGWLIYHRWNHLLTALRYIVPIALIMLYDRWESAYKRGKTNM